MNLNISECQAVGHTLCAISNAEDAIATSPDDEAGIRIVGEYVGEAVDLLHGISTHELRAVCSLVSPRRIDALKLRAK